MPDLIRHPVLWGEKKPWIPGQARNDETVVSAGLTIVTQSRKGEGFAAQLIMLLERH
jgi:hypothetical protein